MLPCSELGSPSAANSEPSAWLANVTQPSWLVTANPSGRLFSASSDFPWRSACSASPKATVEAPVSAVLLQLLDEAVPAERTGALGRDGAQRSVSQRGGNRRLAQLRLDRCQWTDYAAQHKGPGDHTKEGGYQRQGGVFGGGSQGVPEPGFFDGHLQGADVLAACFQRRTVFAKGAHVLARAANGFDLPPTETRPHHVLARHPDVAAIGMRKIAAIRRHHRTVEQRMFARLKRPTSDCRFSWPLSRISIVVAVAARPKYEINAA